jgi:hypothetical protein
MQRDLIEAWLLKTDETGLTPRPDDCVSSFNSEL